MTGSSTDKQICKIEITREILDAMSDDEQALLAVVSHAISEINVFGRLAFLSAGNKEVSATLKVALTHQNLAIIRCFSAKLFEFSKVFIGSNFAKDNPRICRIYEFAAEEYAERELKESHTLVRNLRDFSTNHYDPKRLKKNLPHLAERMNFNLYLTEPDPNSFSMIGDEISFTGQINREFSARKLPDGESGFGRWWKWNIEAWRWAREVHSKTVEILLLNEIPDLTIENVLVEVPPNLIAESGFGLPIFVEELVP